MSDSAEQVTSPRPVRNGRRARGSLRPPPSKSLTQRYFNLALLAEGPTVVRGPLLAGDTEAYLGGLAAMGCEVEHCRGGVRVTPPRSAAEAVVDCGAGGTMLRFLTAAACVVPGRWTLDGTPRLRQRPLAPLARALSELGAEIEWLGEAGHAPLRIAGGPLAGGRVGLDAGESSQYLSALLMAATRAEAGVEITVERLTSAPYVDLTLGALEELGAKVERPAPGRYAVRPGPPRGREVAVEADASAACYAAAAAALTGGRVTLVGLWGESQQGDLGFFELLREMGAEVSWRRGRLEVAGTGALEAVTADLSSMPDQVPTLAALAPFARGTSKITNVAHLTLKESDRLRGMARELARLGASARLVGSRADGRPDGLEIDGVWAQEPPPQAAVVAHSHDDHRVAMSLALVGLRRPGVSIADPGVVEKSYPGFWRDLERLIS